MLFRLSRSCPVLVLSFSAALIAASSALADEGHHHHDPEPHRLTVAGSATERVGPDRVELTLALRTEAPNFATSDSRAESVRAAIAKNAASVCPAGLEVDRSISLAQQKTLAWTAKAKKLEHEIVVRCTVGERSIPAVAMALLDMALQSSDDVTLSRAVSRLNDKRIAQLRAQLAGHAADRAVAQARAVAKASGMVLSAAHTVGVERGSDAPRQRQLWESNFSDKGVSIQEPFRVWSQLAERVELTASVEIEFELEPAD